MTKGKFILFGLIAISLLVGVYAYLSQTELPQGYCMIVSEQGSQFQGVQVNCPEGYNIAGGGFKEKIFGAQDDQDDSKPLGNGWFCREDNSFGEAECYAVCCSEDVISTEIVLEQGSQNLGVEASCSENILLGGGFGGEYKNNNDQDSSFPLDNSWYCQEDYSVDEAGCYAVCGEVNNGYELKCMNIEVQGTQYQGVQIDCPENYFITGGGFFDGSYNNDDQEVSKPVDNGWYCLEDNSNSNSKCYARCCSVSEIIDLECVVNEDCGSVVEELVCYNGNANNKITSPICVDSACEFDTSFELVEECEFGCEDAECLPEPEIECYEDSDCGDDGCAGGGNYCLNDDVYQDFIFFTCNNPGTFESYCSNATLPILLMECGFGCENGFCINEELECSVDSDCGEDYYSENYCYEGNVAKTFTNKGCNQGYCYGVESIELVETCEFGCEQGECLPQPAECSGNEDCGEDYCESWNNYCEENDIYHSRNCYNFSCIEGTCQSETNTEESLVEECEDECSQGECAEEDEGEGNGGGVKKLLSTNFCGDGFCDEEIENEFNCEEDCKIEVLSFGTTEAEEEIELKGKISEKTDYRFLVYLFLLILLLILVVVVVYFLTR